MPTHHIEEDSVTQSRVLDLDDTSAISAMGTVPSGAMLLKAFVLVTTAYAGTAAMEIGTVIVPNAYVDSVQVDLKTLGLTEIDIGTILSSDTAVQLDLDGGSGGGASRVILQYVLGP